MLVNCNLVGEAIEYYYSVTALDLQNQLPLPLNACNYAKIEIDNSLGARDISFIFNCQNFSITGDIEISGTSIEQMIFASNSNTSNICFKDSALFGVNKLVLNSTNVAISQVQAPNLDVNSQNLKANKLDVGIFSVASKNSAYFQDVNAALLSIITSSKLVFSNNKISTINGVDLTSSFLVNSYSKLQANEVNITGNITHVLGELLAGKIVIHGAKVNVSGAMASVNSMNVTATDVAIAGKLLGQEIIINGALVSAKGSSIETGSNIILTGKSQEIAGNLTVTGNLEASATNLINFLQSSNIKVTDGIILKAPHAILSGALQGNNYFLSGVTNIEINHQLVATENLVWENESFNMCAPMIIQGNVTLRGQLFLEQGEVVGDVFLNADRAVLSNKLPGYILSIIKANNIDITNINSREMMVLGGLFNVTANLNLEGNFNNSGKIKAENLYVTNGDFETQKIITITNLASFSGSVKLNPGSNTQVGYLMIGNQLQKASEVICKGCVFEATSSNDNSYIYATGLSIIPTSFSIDNIKSDWDKLIERDNCYKEQTHNCRNHLIALGEDIIFTNPNCQVEQIGKFTTQHDFHLAVNKFEMAPSLLNVGKKLYFEEKPMLSVVQPNCVKELKFLTRIGPYKNYGLVLPEKYGIIHYKTEKYFHIYSTPLPCPHSLRENIYFYHYIDTDENAAFKTVIHAGGGIHGALTKVELGINDDEQMEAIAAPGGALSVVKSNTLIAGSSIMKLVDSAVRNALANTIIQFTTDLGNGNKLITNIDNIEAFFKTNGIDINNFMNHRDFSHAFRLPPLNSPGNLNVGDNSNALVPAGLNIKYYVELDSTDRPLRFDPIEFLNKICFQSSETIYTIDGHYVERLVKEADFITLAKLTKYDQTTLINLLASNAYKAWVKEGFSPGRPLASGQIALLDAPIIWPIWSNICGGVVPKCLSYMLYYNKDAVTDLLVGINVIAEGAIDLSVEGDFITNYVTKIASTNNIVNLQIGGNTLVLGKLDVVSNSTKIAAGANFISIGNIKNIGDLVVQATNVAIAGTIKSEGEISVGAVDQLVLATLKSVSEIGSSSSNYFKHSEKSIGKSGIYGTKINLQSGNDANIIGAETIGQEVYITSKNGKVVIVPLSLYQQSKLIAYRYHSEHHKLEFYQSKIEALLPGSGNITDGAVRFSKEVSALSGGATGIAITGGAAAGVTIDGKKGIVSVAVNYHTDRAMNLVSYEGAISIDTVNETGNEYEKITESRGGFAGLLGDTKTTTTHKSWSNPVATITQASEVIFTTNHDIAVGIDIKAYNIKFNSINSDQDKAIKIISRVSKYSYSIEVEKTGFLFECNSNGDFMIFGSMTTSDSSSYSIVAPTLIQIGGISDDPKDIPVFMVKTNGKFELASSHIEEYRDKDGKFISGKKSKIIIKAYKADLTSIVDQTTKFSAVDSSGFGLGFSFNTKEVSAFAGIVDEAISESTIKTEHKKPPTLNAGSIQIDVKELRDQNARYDAYQMNLKAGIIFHGVAEDQIIIEKYNKLIKAGISMGIKFGAFGAIVDAASRAIKEDPTTPEGATNLAFIGVQIAYNLAMIQSGASGAGGGIWADFSYNNYFGKSTTTYQNPTEIKVGNLTVTTDDITYIGTSIEAYTGFIKAKNSMIIRPAENTQTTESSAENIDVDIPISPTTMFSADAGKSRFSGESRIRMNAKIHVHGDLELNVEGHADFEGISLRAKSLEAAFNSLVLKSAEDLISHDSWGANIGVSGGIPGAISSIGGNIGQGEKHVIRELTELLGEEKCSIIIARALHLNGAMIANAHRDANGNYDDFGALTLRVGELFVHHIKAYDQGHSLGFALSKTSISPSFSLKDGDGLTKGTLGKGDVTCEAADGTCQMEQVNRDVKAAKEFTMHTEISQINAYVPFSTPELIKGENGKTNWEAIGATLVKEAIKPYDELKTSLDKNIPAIGNFLPDLPQDYSKNLDVLIKALRSGDEEEIARARAKLDGKEDDSTLSKIIILAKDLYSYITGEKAPEITDLEHASLKLVYKYFEDLGEKIPSSIVLAILDRHLIPSLDIDGKLYFVSNDLSQKFTVNQVVKDYSLNANIVKSINTELGSQVLAAIDEINESQSTKAPAKNARIETQKDEVIQSLQEELRKSIASDQYLVFKHLDQYYIVSKHAIGGGIIMGKEKFAEAFPDAYEKLADYREDVEKFIGGAISNVDGKLEKIFGNDYAALKQKAKELLTEIDKEAPQIVSDGIKLFTLGAVGNGAVKLVSKATAKLVDLAKKIPVVNKLDLPDSIREVAHKPTKVPEDGTEHKVRKFEIKTDSEVHPSTPVGHKQKEISVNPGSNARAVINGREYSGHALDRMQERGLTPTMVEHVIQVGTISNTNKLNRLLHYDSNNKVTVVTEQGNIITVIYGGTKK